MLGGILAGAIQGGGQAMQQNAQSQIEQKRQKALRELDQEMAFERDDRQFEREKEMTQEERLIEERRRREDRAWEIQSNEANRAHDARLASIRASSGGGRGGYAPGGIEKDVEYFRSLGYSAQEAEDRALMFRGRGAGDPMAQLGEDIDRMAEMLGNEDLLMNIPEEEVDALRSEYVDAQKRYREMSQSRYSQGSSGRGLVSGAQNNGGGSDGSGEDDYPQEGDMVGNPGSGQGDAPSRETGQQPGPATKPAPSDPDAKSDDILSQFGIN